jgi:hypothetical protein
MKGWFVVTGTLGLLGLFLVFTAQSAASANEALTTGAPQQTVVALWHLRDLAVVVAGELILLVLAASMIGYHLVTRAETKTPPAEAGGV